MSVQNKLQGKVPADTIKGIINNLKQLQPSKKLLTLWANDARNIPQLWQGLQENGLKLEEVSPGLESEYILSKYLVNTEYVPGGSGNGFGSGIGDGIELKGHLAMTARPLQIFLTFNNTTTNA